MAAETKKVAQDLSAKLRTQKLRTAIAAIVFVVMAAGLILGVSTGTMSGFGWESISALCPLGAVATMLATKTMVPRAVISLVIMALLILVVGRAFCAWLCPSMLITRIQEFLRTPKKRRELAAETHDKMVDIAKYEITQAKESAGVKANGLSAKALGATYAAGAGASAATVAAAATSASPANPINAASAASASAAVATASLSAQEKKALSGCGAGSCTAGCASCASAKQPHKKLRFPPLRAGRRPALHRHLRLSGVLPGMPGGPHLCHGAGGVAPVRRRRHDHCGYPGAGAAHY